MFMHGTYLNVQIHTSDQDRLGLHRWLAGQWSGPVRPLNLASN